MLIWLILLCVMEFVAICVFIYVIVTDYFRSIFWETEYRRLSGFINKDDEP